jgi:hypothetical protein
MYPTLLHLSRIKLQLDHLNERGICLINNERAML